MMHARTHHTGHHSNPHPPTHPPPWCSPVAPGEVRKETITGIPVGPGASERVIEELGTDDCVLTAEGVLAQQVGLFEGILGWGEVQGRGAWWHSRWVWGGGGYLGRGRFEEVGGRHHAGGWWCSWWWWRGREVEVMAGCLMAVVRHKGGIKCRQLDWRHWMWWEGATCAVPCACSCYPAVRLLACCLESVSGFL